MSRSQNVETAVMTPTIHSMDIHSPPGTCLVVCRHYPSNQQKGRCVTPPHSTDETETLQRGTAQPLGHQVGPGRRTRDLRTRAACRISSSEDSSTASRSASWMQVFSVPARAQWTLLLSVRSCSRAAFTAPSRPVTCSRKASRAPA